MSTEDAIKFFTSRTLLAKALGIRLSAISQWGEFPPELRQHQIQNLTQSALVVGPEARKSA